MFSEYYFYLTAFIAEEEVRKNFDIINDLFPTIYRINRIKVCKEKLHIPYRSRFVKRIDMWLRSQGENVEVDYG